MPSRRRWNALRSSPTASPRRDLRRRTPAPSGGRGIAPVSDAVALVTVEDIARAYDFGSSHPLRPERVLLTYDAVRDLGLTALSNVSEIPSRSATDAEIEAVHDEEFVAMVKAVDAGTAGRREALEFGLGTPDNPIFDGMHRASAAVCGASITAAEAVATGRVQHA